MKAILDIFAACGRPQNSETDPQHVPRCHRIMQQKRAAERNAGIGPIAAVWISGEGVFGGVERVRKINGHALPARPPQRITKIGQKIG